MARYIDAEAFEKEFCKDCDFKVECKECTDCSNCVILAWMRETSTADVEPVCYGQWEKHEDSLFGKYYTCSECGLDIVPRDCFPKIETWYYCPFCGAKMRR